MEIYSHRQFKVQYKALAGSQVWGQNEMRATFVELVKMVGPDHSGSSVKGRLLRKICRRLREGGRNQLDEQGAIVTKGQ